MSSKLENFPFIFCASSPSGFELFDEAIELKPEFARAYSERGRAKLMKGDKNGSVEDLKKALELNPEGEEAQKINGKFSNQRTYPNPKIQVIQLLISFSYSFVFSIPYEKRKKISGCYRCRMGI